MIRTENMVPIVKEICSFLSAPISWAIYTCPPVENPILSMVAKVNTWLAIETADRPKLPTKRPTISISTREYSTCIALDAIKGRANRISCLGMFPSV